MVKWIKKHSLILKDAFLSTLFCLFLTFLLSLIILNLSFLNPFKEAFKDFRFSDIYYAEQIQDNNVSKDIILVNIEHKSRLEIAFLLESLIETKPKVIGVDAIFRELKNEEEDKYLSKFLSNSLIISAINFDRDSIISNHPIFNSKNNGFININFNGGSVIRTTDFIYKKDTSFATKIALKFGKKLNYNELKSSKRIKYFGNYKSFIHFEFDEFMTLKNRDIFKNKIVLLGYLGQPLGSKNDIEDKFFTPLNLKTSGKSYPDMFGVVVHANILKMLIEDSFITEVSSFWLYTFTFISVFIFMIFLLKLERKGEIYNRTFKWLVLFIYTVVLLYFHLLLYNYDIYLNVFFITGITVISSNLFIFYVHLIKFIKTKRIWKSYLD